MKGVVSRVNKDGIKIGEKWYNATEECSKFVKPEIQGCEVEITLIENSNKFSFIKILTQFKASEVPKLTREQELTYRAMALSYAKDLCVSQEIEPSEVITIAEGFLYWINTGKRISEQ